MIEGQHCGMDLGWVVVFSIAILSYLMKEKRALHREDSDLHSFPRELGAYSRSGRTGPRHPLIPNQYNALFVVFVF